MFLDLIEKNAGDGVRTHYNHLGELRVMYKYLKLTLAMLAHYLCTCVVYSI